MKVQVLRPVCFDKVDYPVGIHEMPDQLASHWYFLALVANGSAFIVEAPAGAAISKEKAARIVNAKVEKDRGARLGSAQARLGAVPASSLAPAAPVEPKKFVEPEIADSVEETEEDDFRLGEEMAEDELDAMDDELCDLDGDEIGVEVPEEAVSKPKKKPAKKKKKR